jgi:hypothetical protein
LLTSSSKKEKMDEGEKVYLHVYDLSMGMAKQFSMAFVGKYVEGIWYVNIEI